jgi:hypothetical protein
MNVRQLVPAQMLPMPAGADQAGSPHLSGSWWSFPQGRDSMRRTEVLHGVRMLKFRDVFGRCEEGR